MALEVMAVGFGRTGTTTLERALELLGIGPCASDVSGLEMWTAAASTDDADRWSGLVGYQVVADWPAALFWRELAEAFPHAQAILTVRDFDEWYQSMTSVIVPMMEVDDDHLDATRRRFVGATRESVVRLFGGRFADKAHARTVWDAHNADVIAAFASQRLLVYCVADGWDPLCRFLGRPVPDATFPHLNTTDDFLRTVQTARAERKRRTVGGELPTVTGRLRTPRTTAVAADRSPTSATVARGDRGEAPARSRTLPSS